MSASSPLTAIKQWFTSQPDEVQRELALLLGAMLFDVEHIVLWDPKQSIPLLLDWMDENGKRYRQIGKMLSFRVCLESILQKRDSLEDWAESEAFIRSAAVDGDAEMKESTAAMIAKHPARAKQWIELSADWHLLAARIFDQNQLDLWALKA